MPTSSFTFEFRVAGIFETIEMVALGLSSSPPPSGEARIPNALFDLRGEGPVPTKDDFDQWLINTALRRFIEVYSGFLEDAGTVASLVHRSKNPGYELDLGAEKSRINSLNFSAKLDHIATKIGRDLSQAEKEKLFSINRARNCFEHSQGIVRTRDLDPGGADVMTVKWTGVDAIIIDASGVKIQEVTSMPVDIPPLGAFKGLAVERTKSFALGSSVTFDSSEITEIGLTLQSLGLKIQSLIVESTPETD